MSHTKVSTIVIWALIGGLGGYFLDAALAASGQAVIVPNLVLPLALAAIGVLVVVAAVPVRRTVRGRPGARRVDPFYATRVVVFAKASALAGALLGGAGAGILLYLLTRSVVAGLGSSLQAAGMLVGGIVLLAGGLVAERMCTVPPDDDDPGGGVGAA